MISSPLVPFSAVSDVKASRAIDGTEYTNSSGKIMHVSVSITHHIVEATTNAFVMVAIDGSTVMSPGLPSCPTAGLYVRGAFSFIVPVGSTYKITSVVTGTSTNTLDFWSETI